MQAIIDQMVHRDMWFSFQYLNTVNRSIPVMEMPFPLFLFFPFISGIFLHSPGASSFSMLLFQLLPLLLTFLSSLCVFPPSFIRPYFFPSCYSLCLCLFILSASDSPLPLLQSCFRAHSLDFLPFLL